MLVAAQHYRSAWFDAEQACLKIIDQTLLPHRFEIVAVQNLSQACVAISDMQVRGAPLIGITAAFGLALALEQDASDQALSAAADALLATRPTAVNLRWALTQMRSRLTPLPQAQRASSALELAQAMAEADVQCNSQIGEQGLTLLSELSQQKQGACLNILTHCNAGWLATVDWGTALAPIYKAHNAGIDIHVWVDETRPRNQGAHLTCWELAQQGIKHTLISDNTGGHLMQQGLVDACIVGSDRTSANGDVCNKIGTYLKALAAFDNDIPFYVALPSSTIDWHCSDGIKEIPIEQRDVSEVTRVHGRLDNGNLAAVEIAPAGTQAANYAFDVTPARLVTALITEFGVFEPQPVALSELRQQLEQGNG